jgi:hypothetical protein
MSILGFLFLVFVLYLGYRLVFDFILPIYRTTTRIKKGFREMQEKMNQDSGQQSTVTEQNNSDGTKNKVGDYIDFEEIKD